MSLRAIALFWLGLALALALVLYALRDILLPFVTGSAVAYLLNPVATRLSRFGINRLVATLVIVVVFVAALVVVSIVLVPALIDQVGAFSHDVPTYVQAISAFVHDRIGAPLADAVGMSRSALDQHFSSALSDLVTGMLDLVTSLWTGGRLVVSVVWVAVITPVVAFYLLQDWARMIAQIDAMLPQRYAPTIRAVLGEINSTVAALLRGQLSVSLILAMFYSASLSLAHLNQGLLIGIVTGLLTFIPYVGSYFGAAIYIGIGLIQFWPDWSALSVIGAVFLVGQFLEGYVLQPMLIGGRIGLHPVWLLFAIFAFSSLLGVLGLLLAVPLAAVVGVLVRFALRKYLASPLYHDDGPSAPEATP